MKQLLKSVSSNAEILAKEVKFFHQLPRHFSTSHQLNGRVHNYVKHGKPIKREGNGKPAEFRHSWFKWNYKPLPVPTSETDNKNPLFAIRPPEFKLRRSTGIARKDIRLKAAEIAAAKRDPGLERLARHRQLLVSLDEVDKEWRENFGLAEVTKLASFYGINRDIFNNNTFEMKTLLDISFDTTKIHWGNILTPSLLRSPPTEITYTPPENNEFTSLILTNPDSHPLHSSKEIIHWMVVNIPSGGGVSDGNEIVDYLPPLPWNGSGHHRHVFALYKHTQPITIDAQQFASSNSLAGRTFSTSEFTSSVGMEPIGLSWCQVSWDGSVSTTCGLLSDVKEEPRFDFERYVDPKTEFKELKNELSEMMYRDC